MFLVIACFLSFTVVASDSFYVIEPPSASTTAPPSSEVPSPATPTATQPALPSATTRAPPTTTTQIFTPLQDQKGMSFLRESNVEITSTYWRIYMTLPFEQPCSDIEAHYQRSSQDPHFAYASALSPLLFSDHLLKEANETCQFLQDTHHLSRTKRSAPLEFGSQILKTVFGVARETDLDSIRADLQSIHSAMRNVTTAATAQLSLINSSWSHLQTQNEAIAHLMFNYKAVKLQLTNLTVTLAALTQTQKDLFSTILGQRKADSIVLLSQALHDKMDSIQHILVSAANNRIHPHLLPPVKLRLLLQQISATLPSGFDLFIPASQAHLYYNEPALTAFANNDGFSFLFKIPLRSRKSTFHLYSTRAMPTPIVNTTFSAYIYGMAPYFGITSDGTHYIEMSHTDFARCSTGSVRYCPIVTAILPTTRSSCLVALFTANARLAQTLCSKMIQQQSSSLAIKIPSSLNTWLMYIPSSRQLQLSCLQAGSSVFKTKYISLSAGSYQVSLPNRCQLYSHDFQLPLSFQGLNTVHLTNDDASFRPQLLQSVFSPDQLHLITHLDTSDKKPSKANLPTENKFFNLTVKSYGPRPVDFDNINALLQATDANLLSNPVRLEQHFKRHSTWLTIATALILFSLTLVILRCSWSIRRRWQIRSRSSIPEQTIIRELTTQAAPAASLSGGRTSMEEMPMILYHRPAYPLPPP